MSEILYIQTEKNVEVHSPEIYLGDIAKLACNDQKVLNRNRMRKIFTIPNEAPGRYVVSAADLIKAIAREENSVDVTHIGEPEFVVTYETQKHNHLWYSWIKTGFVCVLTFLGGAFSIMTFNMDVDTSGCFSSFIGSLLERFPQGIPYWNSPILWEWDWALSSFSIILDTKNLPQIQHPWKCRCAYMRMM